MNLKDLEAAVLARTPVAGQEKAKALVVTYGPTLVTMAATDIASWLQYVYAGNNMAAYNLYLRAAGVTGIPTEWDTIGSKWDKANTDNETKYSNSMKIADAVASAILGMVLLVAGF